MITISRVFPPFPAYSRVPGEIFFNRIWQKGSRPSSATVRLRSPVSTAARDAQQGDRDGRAPQKEIVRLRSLPTAFARDAGGDCLKAGGYGIKPGASQLSKLLRLALQAQTRSPARQTSIGSTEGVEFVSFARMPNENVFAAPTLSKRQLFLRRLTSTLLLWAIIISALFFGTKVISDTVFLLIILLLAGTGLMEFYGIVEKLGLVCFKYCGLLGGLLLMIGTFLNLTGNLGLHNSPARVNDFETSFLILFVLGLCVRQFVAKNNTTGDGRPSPRRCSA